MSKLSKQYPTISKWLIKHGRNASDWNMDAAIAEALFSIEENGHYELPASQSVTGNPVILDNSELPGGAQVLPR